MVKNKLSKTVLEMKFMQKTKTKIEKEAEETENIDMYKNESKGMKGKICNFSYENSFELIESLREGRVNYGMSSKPPATAAEETPTKEPPNKKQKHIRFDE